MTEHLDIAGLLNREAIRDCIYRSAMANDTRDAVLWKDAYWPDGTEDHRPFFNGNAHDFVDMIIPILDATMAMTWHQISGIVIRLEGETARVISYANAHVRMKAVDDTPGYDLRTGLRYLDSFAKRDREWRILHRVTWSDWSMQTAIAAPIQEYAGVSHHGMHAATDPARSLFPQGMPQALRIEDATHE